jgi:glycosyltransferase involved in cell wall biosynthesis
MALRYAHRQMKSAVHQLPFNLREDALPNVLVIARDGEINPSARLRILQYLPSLTSQGFEFRTFFIPYGAFPENSSNLQSLLNWADVVFVQRVLSRRLLRLLRRTGKPVVFDLDDAIHYVRPSQYPEASAPRNPKDWALVTYRTLTRGSRYYSSRKRLLTAMLDHAAIVLVGNYWLLHDLGLTDDRAQVLPTAVWVTAAPCKTHTPHLPVTLGWIGVRSNLIHLEHLDGVFRELRRRFGNDVELKVVSNAGFQAAIPTHVARWSLETESTLVESFDIGLMPLHDDVFSRGKCAFKAVFCMSHGLPVVVSPVGANCELVSHGKNGYLASDYAEWVECLSVLIRDADLRGRLGRCARETIEARFSSERVSLQLRDVLLRAHGRNLVGSEVGR